MSNPINDGGSISPRLVPTDTGVEAQGGLSIRDWFAGMALQGYYSRPDLDKDSQQAFALDAYDQADAMLSARTKGGEQ